MKKYFYFLFFLCAYLWGQQTPPPPSSIVPVIDEVKKRIPLVELEDTLSIKNRVHFQENFQERYQSKSYKYTEEPLKEVKKPEKKDKPTPSKNWDWSFLDFFTLNGITTVITWASILFIIGIIGYFLYLNLSNTSFKKAKIITRNLKEVEKLTEEEIIENSNEKEIDELIIEAESISNYRLALRLHFLSIFKQLIDKNKIQYKKNKTNFDYYTELESKDLKRSFKKVSHWYSYIWYGKYPIDKTLYNKALLEFKSLINELS